MKYNSKRSNYSFLIKIILLFLITSKTYAFSAELTQKQIDTLIANSQFTSDHIEDVGIIDKNGVATLLEALESSGTKDQLKRMTLSSERREKKFDEMLNKMDEINNTTLTAIGEIKVNSSHIKNNYTEIGLLRIGIYDVEKKVSDVDKRSSENNKRQDSQISSNEKNIVKNSEDIKTQSYWLIYSLLGALGFLVTCLTAIVIKRGSSAE